MADADGVDIRKGTQELVHVQFDLEHGHGLFEFSVMTTSAVDSFWDVFQDEIKVHFVLLKNNNNENVKG